MASSQLSQLQTVCNTALASYKAARTGLATALNKTPDHDVVADIAASAELYGLNATLKRVKTTDPKVAEAITKLSDASNTLSLAVSQRELHLLALNPAHQRAFVSDGREYRIDMDKGLVTWLDNPSQPEKVDNQKLDKLPYFDTIELDGPDLNAPVISEDEDEGDDDDSPRRRKGRGR
jgi:hypothetical protein